VKNKKDGFPFWWFRGPAFDPMIAHAFLAEGTSSLAAEGLCRTQ
jgi:hypothetical protein